MKIPIVLSLIFLCSGTAHGADKAYFTFKPTEAAVEGTERLSAAHVCVGTSGIYRLTMTGSIFFDALKNRRHVIKLLLLITQLTQTHKYSRPSINLDNLTQAWIQCFYGDVTPAALTLLSIIYKSADYDLTQSRWRALSSFIEEYGCCTIQPYLPKSQQHLCKPYPPKKPITHFIP